MKYKCFDCQIIFEAVGTRVDYTDPIYGPCSKIVAECPACSGESSEYRIPKQSKGSTQPQDSCPSYHNGSCSCCH